MRKKIFAAAVIFSMVSTSAIYSQAAESSSQIQMTGYTLVTDVYGDGQKPWYIVVEYSADIDADSVTVEDYTVEDYEIADVYVSSTAELPEESEDGCYVIIELSTDYTTTNYGGSGSSADSSTDAEEESDRPSGEVSGDLAEDSSETAESGQGNNGEEKQFHGMDSEELSSEDFPSNGEDFQKNGEGMQGNGGNRGGFMSSSASNQETVTFMQTGEITSTEGEALEGSAAGYTTDYTENTNLQVDNFEQYTFTAEDGTELMYSIYLPENYSEDTEYPLVLFMPDATGEGDDMYLALTESLGGVIWTTEEWQEDYECIVLVPQYTNDNSDDPVYTVELVNAVAAEYSVDTDRLYLVGQSSGTIRSIKLMIDYPDMFAGAMLVAGQADSAYEDLLAGLADQNIWFVASEGDARAYPGIQAIVDAVEAEGTEVTIAQWSADLSDEEQEALAEEMAAEGTSINWTIFDAATVMEEDVTVSDATEHMNTWRVAYNLDTVREWLFAQSK